MLKDFLFNLRANAPYLIVLLAVLGYFIGW